MRSVRPAYQAQFHALSQRAILLAWLVLALFAPFSHASTVTVFGPETFERGKGKPVTETRSFAVSNPRADALLRIEVNRVSSAVITINGVQVFGPSDFNQNVTFLESAVALLAENELAVELRGNPGGTLTVEITTSGPPISIEITSPGGGTTVSTTSVLVSGAFEGPANTGVTVSGVVASIFNNQFFATVPLLPGDNTLTGTATTPDGTTVSDAVTVSTTATGAELEPLEVLADPENGIAPLTVQFKVVNNTGDLLQRFEVDFDGDGSVDITTTDPTALAAEHTYETPGAFQAQSIVTDGAGAVHTITHLIVVNSFESIDAMLRAIYTGMLDSLRVGDIEGGLNFITDSTRAKYQAIFTAIGSDLATVVDQLGTIERASISSDFAEYTVVREKNGERFAYFIYFLRGDDGVWRIESM